jgi:hypothetical protein
MAYELWDVEFGNLLADFATEDAALAVVRDTVEARGADSITHLALAYEDENGDTHPIAAGLALADRAHRSVSMR